MIELQYRKASNLSDAAAFLRQMESPVNVLAGATNVMVDIRNKKITCGILLDISDISDISGISIVDGTIHIGALTTIEMIAASQLLRHEAPALSMAANVFADPLIRKRATVGGNLVNASPAADMAPSLLALDASVILRNQDKQRTMPLCEFFLAPGKTACEKDELLIAVEFAPSPKSAFVKLGLRKAMAISIATAAATLVCDMDGKIIDCRIGVGAVAPTPLRATLTERAVLSQVGNIAHMLEFCAADIEKTLLKEISPISDIRASAEYRRQIAPVVVKRALTSACCLREGDCHKE